jgi:hypothetical protein
VNVPDSRFARRIRPSVAPHCWSYGRTPAQYAFTGPPLTASVASTSTTPGRSICSSGTVVVTPDATVTTSAVE